MFMNDEVVLQKKDSVIERFGEELLLFDSSTGKLFEVTDVGKTIWIMLKEKHSIAEIKAQLKAEFPDVKTIDSDVHDFITKLQSLDLIEPLK
jgi:hypothetical protein